MTRLRFGRPIIACQSRDKQAAREVAAAGVTLHDWSTEDRKEFRAFAKGRRVDWKAKSPGRDRAGGQPRAIHEGPGSDRPIVPTSGRASLSPGPRSAANRNGRRPTNRIVTR